MPRSVAQKITILDMMILVAATALGIVAGRAQLAVDKFHGDWWGIDAHYGSVSFVLIWSLGLLLIQLRRGRRSWLRLSRRPGFAACVAGLASLGSLVI